MKTQVCKFNLNLECLEERCNKCGWNPEVEKKRKAKLRKKIVEKEQWIVGEKRKKKKED